MRLHRLFADEYRSDFSFHFVFMFLLFFVVSSTDPSSPFRVIQYWQNHRDSPLLFPLEPNTPRFIWLYYCMLSSATIIIIGNSMQINYYKIDWLARKISNFAISFGSVDRGYSIWMMFATLRKKKLLRFEFGRSTAAIQWCGHLSFCSIKMLHVRLLSWLQSPYERCQYVRRGCTLCPRIYVFMALCHICDCMRARWSQRKKNIWKIWPITWAVHTVCAICLLSDTSNVNRITIESVAQVFHGLLCRTQRGRNLYHYSAYEIRNTNTYATHSIGF